jgi:hypothetical protein
MNPAKSSELHDRNDGTGWWSVTIDGYDLLRFGDSVPQVGWPSWLSR